MSEELRIDSYYEVGESSRLDSIYYEQADSDTSHTTEDEYDHTKNEDDEENYASPIPPVDYEVPEKDNDRRQEMMERSYEPEPPPSHLPPMLHMRSDDLEECDYQNRCHDAYTALTHTHIPSVYSTPSHSICEFRKGATAPENVLDIVTLESSSSTPTHRGKQPHRLSLSTHTRSQTKVAIFVFLIVAVVVGMVSLVVSVVAVLATSDNRGNSTNNSSSTGSMENMMEDRMGVMIEMLQEQVQRLQITVEQVMNRTTASVDLSSLFDSCETEMQRERCNPELGLGVAFSCVTDTLPYERDGFKTLSRACYGIGSTNYPLLTANLISNDNSSLMYCHCHVMESDLLTFDSAASTGIECVLDILRCPVQQILDAMINT